MQSTTSKANQPHTFSTGPKTQDRYGISHVTLWRWMHDEKLGFPKPLKINRLNYWKLSDLEAWEAARMEAVN